MYEVSGQPPLSNERITFCVLRSEMPLQFNCFDQFSAHSVCTRCIGTPVGSLKTLSLRTSFSREEILIPLLSSHYGRYAMSYGNQWME